MGSGLALDLGVCCYFAFPWRGWGGVYILWDGMVIRGGGGTEGLASAGRGVGLLASCILGWAGRVWSGLAESGFLRGLYVGYFRRCSGLVSLAVRVHRAGTRERGVGLFGEPAARLPILLPTKAYLHWRHERAAITAEVSDEAADIRLQFLGLWEGPASNTTQHSGGVCSSCFNVTAPPPAIFK
jgi:hypothetical protein